MINITYAALHMRAQTEKTTFSCKDECTLTKHTRRWTYSALRYFFGLNYYLPKALESSVPPSYFNKMFVCSAVQKVSKVSYLFSGFPCLVLRQETGEHSSNINDELIRLKAV